VKELSSKCDRPMFHPSMFNSSMLNPSFNLGQRAIFPTILTNYHVADAQPMSDSELANRVRHPRGA
jgi:hypothetical protein